MRMRTSWIATVGIDGFDGQAFREACAVSASRRYRQAAVSSTAWTGLSGTLPPAVLGDSVAPSLVISTVVSMSRLGSGQGKVTGAAGA